MNEAHDAIDAAISEADRLRRLLKKKTTNQVRSQEERALIKATSLTWFNTHRPIVAHMMPGQPLEDIDGLFKDILACSDRAAVRSGYDSLLKAIRKELVDLRLHSVSAGGALPAATTDAPPDFSLLISDAAMQNILVRRWKECSGCIAADAPLAATVMMGGLLEALLLARVNQVHDKGKIFRAGKAPTNKKTGKALPLNEWTLRHYIDVAHELGWVSQSAKDVGVVLRDYRNYVHPHKELTHGVQLTQNDAALFWEVTKSISKQLIAG